MKTLVVHAWPGPAPTLQDGLFAILVDTSALGLEQVLDEVEAVCRRHLPGT